MQLRLYLLLCTLLCACIPVQLAPQISDYKIKKGQRFHKDLSHHYSFIFNNPKNDNEFYNYMNTVYELQNIDELMDIPIAVEEKIFLFSFYEVDKGSTTLNLIPVIVDAKLNEEGFDPMLESLYSTRKGYWYIIVTVFDENGNDALHPSHRSRLAIQKYLNELRTTFLDHDNYYEVLLKKKP